ncbi:actin cytoskeleton-regulatory complex protein PAN1-like [Crotalus tigris]|uniref:actin cytoskeleton-regulatory complex protein PAN1-like n=1 Tax=Crotalus tigris TaxID=88082 RepID=UPI00192F4344|nr:actin cytoskeleton-regulatory complex protein PAN1-like [Crotalus tigris]
MVSLLRLCRVLIFPPFKQNADPLIQIQGGRKKAKTKHLSTKEPSKTAEREASRRHQALEQEFSKAQRLRSREAELVPPASLASSPYEPSLVPSYQAPRAGSPQGGTEQVSLSAPRQHIPISPLPGPSISPANISTHTPETTAAGVPSAERSLWAQQFQSFMHQAFNQFMSSSLAAGPSQVSPSPPLPADRTGRPQSAGSGISETSSQFGETESVDLVTTEGPMSEDEEGSPGLCLGHQGVFVLVLFRENFYHVAPGTTGINSSRPGGATVSDLMNASPRQNWERSAQGRRG